MDLLSIGSIVLFAITLGALAYLRRKARKNKDSTSLQGRVEISTSTAAKAPGTIMPGPSTPAYIDDDGDDDKYWRRYYR